MQREVMTRIDHYLQRLRAENLFQIMQKLKAQGISIIYISHRKAEVFGQCDRVSVLRDGQYIGTFDVDKTNSTEVVNMMVGREIGDLYPPKAEQTDKTTDVLLQVSGFKNEGRFEDISFELFKGEILGFPGLVGAGRSELAKAICGLYPKRAGEVIFKGSPLNVRSYEDAIRQGIGVIMISSELPEIIGMCDRVLVMHEGRKSDIFSGDQITEEHIIQLASGMNV